MNLSAIPVPAWVTSDTHLGHANILTYCPWRQTWARDIQHHDDALIAAWNSVVGVDDWVLLLGDVALGNAAIVGAYRQRLHGRICVVLGNHDRTATSMHTLGFDLVIKHGIIDDNGYRVLCVHDPRTVQPAWLPGVQRLLHGHHHGDDHRGTIPESVRDLARDCGVDAVRSVAPVPWEQVR